MKHFKGLMLLAAIGVTAVMVYNQASAATYNYGEVLAKATAWFDANRCGSDVATDNVFSSWRSACHTSDAVNGGFHDAGDHVKFGLPAAFSASAMGWSYYEFTSEYESAGAKAKVLQELKVFSDYFLNCWNGSSFVYQVGDGGTDHSYWGAPEAQTGSRPSYSASSSSPASDICGQTAGSLALMYLNYKDVDATYAAKCLSTAKSLFTLGKTKLGVGTAGSAFYSSSSYYDDLCWGAIWLYLATQDSSYLSLATSWLEITGIEKGWTYCWDDSTIANVIMMYKITKNQKYYDALIYNFDWFKNSVSKTPAGLPYINSWGALRYSSAQAGLIYVAYKEFGISDYNTIANRAIDYCLGDNPKNLCYITNYGSNSVKHPHHRANEPKRDGSTHGMVGALAGGPDSSDGYTDDVNQYVYTEVALDYNASFLLGCAGRSYVAHGVTSTSEPPATTPSKTPVATVTPSPTVTPSKTPMVTVTPSATPTSAKCTVTYSQNDWGSGATVAITIKNNSTTAVNGWELAWSFAGNQKISNMWNAAYTQSGTAVTITNMGYNGNIPAGGSLSFGFNITYSGSNAKPASITLNGTNCTVE